jgi:hypothetical protein
LQTLRRCLTDSWPAIMPIPQVSVGASLGGEQVDRGHAVWFQVDRADAQLRYGKLSRARVLFIARHDEPNGLVGRDAQVCGRELDVLDGERNLDDTVGPVW